jgi:type IV pilus assembly protein PilA
MQVSPRRGRRLSASDGFSLIELLVVILVIAILCAIAIPSFIGQTAKATNTQAKELARTAETTAETIATDNDGSYEGVSVEALAKVEPSIRTSASHTEAFLSGATHGEHEYSVTATASDGDEFTITKKASGVVTRRCVSPVTKTGCAGGESSSW